MSLNNNKVELSPVFSVLYFLIIIALTVGNLCQITFDTHFSFGLVLQPVFPLGFSIPLTLLVILFVIFSLLSVVLFHQIIVRELELDKKITIICSVLPLFFLSSGSFAVATMLSFQMFILALCFRVFSRMAAGSTDEKKLFLLGLLFGLFTLISNTAMLLMLSMLISLITLRVADFRQSLIYLIGFLIPLAYVAAILFLFDYSFVALYGASSLFLFDLDFLLSRLQDPIAIGAVVVVIATILNVYSRASEYKISIRRMWDSLLMMFFMSILSFVFVNENNVTIFFVFILFSFLLFMSQTISDSRRKLIRIILYLITVTPFIYLQIDSMIG